MKLELTNNKMICACARRFVEKVQDKPGNIGYYRKRLRALNLLVPRQQLNDKHVQQFKEIKQYHEQTGATWEASISYVFAQGNMPVASEEDIGEQGVQELLSQILHEQREQTRLLSQIHDHLMR